MADSGARRRGQLLHLVFGGELTSLDRLDFADLKKLDIVGIYPELCGSLRRLEGRRAPDRGRRPYALFHRASAPAARSGERKAASCRQVG